MRLNCNFMLFVGRLSCIQLFFYLSLCFASAQSIADLKKSAEFGDATSQLELGRAYFQQFEYTQALEWFRKSADQNNPDAQRELGILLLYGKPATKNNSVQPSPMEGVHWLSKAANQNHGMAMMELGECYRKGLGVKTNLVESYKWFLLGKEIKGVKPMFMDQVALKLTTAQIKEAEAMALKFKTDPKSRIELPEFELKLQGISD